MNRTADETPLRLADLELLRAAFPSMRVQGYQFLFQSRILRLNSNIVAVGPRFARVRSHRSIGGKDDGGGVNDLDVNGSRQHPKSFGHHGCTPGIADRAARSIVERRNGSAATPPWLPYGCRSLAATLAGLAAALWR
jgi:hypothetical protein